MLSLNPKVVRKWKSYLGLSFIIILTSIFIRLFLFEIFYVQSSSMKNTLFPGDLILVNKIEYGPRLPKSLDQVPLLDLFFRKIPNDAQENLNPSLKDYIRLKGYGKYQNGDLVVFDHPSKSKSLIKRCIGIPGDTVEIVEGRIKINSIRFVEPQTIISQKPLGFSFDISDIETDSIEKITPFELKNTSWISYTQEPVVLPRRNQTITIDEENFRKYNHIINTYEHVGHSLEWKDGKCFSGEKIVLDYTFKKSYFFFLGDNRNNSSDSKIFGSIPEEKIIGKVSFTIYSSRRQD
ncbi:MAG: signal peptidase I [Bacteroidota bacterium]